MLYEWNLNKKDITLTSKAAFDPNINPVIEYLAPILQMRKLRPKKLSSCPEL